MKSNRILINIMTVESNESNSQLIIKSNRILINIKIVENNELNRMKLYAQINIMSS